MEIVKDVVLDFYDLTDLGFSDPKMAVFIVIPNNDDHVILVFRPYLPYDKNGVSLRDKELYC